MTATTGATAGADALRAAASRHCRASSTAMAQEAAVAMPPLKSTPLVFSNRQLRMVTRARPPSLTAALASCCRGGQDR